MCSASERYQCRHCAPEVHQAWHNRPLLEPKNQEVEMSEKLLRHQTNSPPPTDRTTIALARGATQVLRAHRIRLLVRELSLEQ
jgi:hypothetical protein